MEAVPAGSYLAISHPGSDLLSREALAGMTDVADRMIRQAFIFRSRQQVARFFEGTDLVAPGLVRVEEWRPDPGSAPGRSSMWGAVGRKR